MKKFRWVRNRKIIFMKMQRGEKNIVFTKEDAKKIAKKLNIDFSKEKFDLDQFTMGVNVELEHGSKFFNTNVTKDNPILTGKIALAHLQEIPDYYTRLKKLEDEALAYWSNK